MKTKGIVDLAFDCLQRLPNSRLTVREIGSWIFVNHPDWCDAKRKRSQNPNQSDAELIAQLSAEVGALHPRLLSKYPSIRATEGRPRRFYYSEQSEEAEIEAAESERPVSTVSQAVDTTGTVVAAPPRLLEKDLYPLLARYLIDELKVRSLRIDESKSSNRQGPAGNKWLFPDLVGLENLTEDWHETIRGCVEVQPESRIKLWSFEVKRLINRSNVREVFFQTVSNSSWANLAYLVAGEITGDETMKELQRLAGLHGVGVILLDIENPSESQILLHARERAPVDWNTVSRIAEENGDFLNYVKLITKFYKLGEIDKRDWLAQPTV